MSIPPRRRPRLWFAALFVAAAACSSSTDSKTAGAVAAAAGDNQTVSTGQLASTPLRVLVQDTNGSPAAGVTVTWSIVQGNGTLSSTTPTTDQNGYASANYTAGSTSATTTIEAKAGSNEVFFKLFVVST